MPEQPNVRGKVSPELVEKHLEGQDFPTDKQKLIEHARNQGASNEVLALFEELPDEQFMSPMDVIKTMGPINS